MPEINTYSFSLKEILELMIKSAGLHDGEWQLIIGLSFTGGNFGPNEDSVVPGAITAITGLGLIRATAESPKALVLNAARVNPSHPTASPPPS